MTPDANRDLEHLRTLRDDELVAELGRLDEAACAVGAAIVAHLLVIKERSIHLDRGYGSIVDYCVEWLGCSKDVAYKRAAAVKVAEAWPFVLESLAAGELSMSALIALAPYRDDRDLIRDAVGRSKRQVQKLIASRYPDARLDPDPVRVRSVTDGLSKLELTLPDTLLEMIDEALDLDSHIDPGRDVVALLDRALADYVEQRKRVRFAVVDRPRKGRGDPTGTVPAEARRRAYERSGGQCEYRAADGTRCTSRAFLEVDHVVPRAKGGGHDQVRILCRAHNQRAAETALGRDLMDRKRREAAVRRDVVAGLRTLGLSARGARDAADAAIDVLGPDASVEAALREALRHSGQPRDYAVYAPAAATTRGRAREAARPWRGSGLPLHASALGISVPLDSLSGTASTTDPGRARGGSTSGDRRVARAASGLPGRPC